MTLSQAQFDTLAPIADANTGMARRGLKLDVAEATFKAKTLTSLRDKGLIETVEHPVGRYATPRAFVRPTQAGWEALSAD